MSARRRQPSLLVCAALGLALVVLAFGREADGFFPFQFEMHGGGGHHQQQRQRRPNPALEPVEEVDYYAVLGLTRETATEQDVRRQFRMLSKKYHPDQNKGADAKETYRKISRANEVLSDKRKKKLFDIRGEAGVRQLEKADQLDAQGGGNHGMMDPFAQFFGGGGAANNLKGGNKELAATIGLEDIYNGNNVMMTYEKQEVCKTCKGTGAASGSAKTACSQCRGSGMVVKHMQLAPGIVQQVQQQCSVCKGTGTMYKNKCAKCKGHTVHTVQAKLQLDIERGIPEGHKLTFEMEADESPEVIPGDLIVVLSSRRHNIFTRRANGVDLDATLKITVKEALLGFSRTLTHLDGRSLNVERHDTVTPFGTEVRIRGEGMPRHNIPSEKGDLYVRVEFELPKTLTAAQREAIEELFEE